MAQKTETMIKVWLVQMAVALATNDFFLNSSKSKIEAWDLCFLKNSQYKQKAPVKREPIVFKESQPHTCDCIRATTAPAMPTARIKNPRMSKGIFLPGVEGTAYSASN